jgi:hypothetical protein
VAISFKVPFIHINPTYPTLDTSRLTLGLHRYRKSLYSTQIMMIVENDNGDDEDEDDDDGNKDTGLG